MHSNGSSRGRVRSNVNVSGFSSRGRSSSKGRELEASYMNDHDLIADQEVQIEEFQHKLQELFQENLEFKTALKQRDDELDKARNELVNLRTLVDTSQVDARRAALAVQSVPKKAAADWTKMENDGRVEELEIKCKELEMKNKDLEARLKKCEEGYAVQLKLRRSSAAELDLEKSKSEKFQMDLKKLKNIIDSLLSNAVGIRDDHEANPSDAASPVPSSATAMERSVSRASLMIESDLEEELEEVLETTVPPECMEGVNFSKLNDLGIDLEDSD